MALQQDKRSQMGLFPRSFLERIDAKADGVPRTVWVARVLEEALGNPGRRDEAEGRVSSPTAGAASPLEGPVEARQAVVDRAPSTSPREPVSSDSEDLPTIAQVVGWSNGALTTPRARAAIEDGSWREWKRKAGL